MSRLGDWLDVRTGYRALVRETLDEPVAGGARWAYVWGSALTLSLLVQVVTGWLLMSAYAPSATTAWASVHHITFTLRAGWLVRGLHHFGAQAMVVLLVLHLGQTALYGAYKKPREMNWYFGLGLLFVTLGFALTGYLLPWDQKGYWATRVATNIAGSLPLAGGFLQGLLVGGAEYGHATLTRFYTLHVAVLPAAAVLLLVLHVGLFRKHGVTPAATVDTSKAEHFYPKQVAKDLAIGVAVLAVVLAFTVRQHGAPLDAPADPSSDYPARPDWYFLALFEALKYFRGALEPVGAIGLPLLVVGYLVALPLIDRRPTNALRPRLLLLTPLAIVLLGAGALTLASLRGDAGNAEFQASRRLATKRAEHAIRLASQGVPPEGPLAMLRDDPETRGADLFVSHCAVCHALGDLGARAGKETAPDLTGFGSRAWVLKMLEDPDAVFGKTPFRGMMPSMVHPPADPEAAKIFMSMTASDQEAVATFLEAQATGEKGAGLSGEKIVKSRCTACHRVDGATLDEDSLAPELRGWGSVAWIESQIKDPGAATYPRGAVAPDLKGHMPAFGEKLSENDVRLLARWLHDRRAR